VAHRPARRVWHRVGDARGAPNADAALVSAPVNDFAHVIDATAAQEIDARIRALQAASGDAVVVATVPTLEPFGSIEEYAVRLFEQAKIGQRDKDNGFLVLVAVKEHKVRIEVGYGLEEFITDGFAGDTIRQMMLPEFRRNDYSAGSSPARQPSSIGSRMPWGDAHGGSAASAAPERGRLRIVNARARRHFPAGFHRVTRPERRRRPRGLGRGPWSGGAAASGRSSAAGRWVWRPIGWGVRWRVRRLWRGSSGGGGAPAAGDRRMYSVTRSDS